MKLMFFILFVFSISLKSEEKLDSIFNNPPVKLNKFEFKFPEYKLDYLKNSIKLYLVPDNSQMITNLRVLIGNEETFQNAKPGSLDLLTGMLLKGTQTKKAEEIAESIDFYGANVSFSNSDDYISLNVNVLNKHLDKILKILDDVLFNVKFNKDELKKLKKQYIAGIEADKSNPSSLASKLSKKVIYGNNYYYSNFPNEKEINAVEIEDLEKLKNELFIANNIYLGIYGSYSNNDLKSIYTLFDKFKKSTKNEFTSNYKQNYKPGVYFIEREGSVQSSVRIISPAPKFSDKEFEKIQFTSNIIGSGFIGRLFKELREKHSYTYSPSASVSNNLNSNYFSANADVKAEVTDSAISVMLEIFNDIRTNSVSSEELEAAKNFKIGNYYMAFESSDYTISLLQNSEFKGKRAKQLESFDSRVLAISENDIQRMANEFLASSNLSIIVVGPKSVKDKLSKFGNVIEYDKNISPVNDFKKVSMDYEDIFEDFLESIGGDDIFDDVKSLKQNGNIKLNFNGQDIEGEYQEIMSDYNKKYSMQDIKVNKQESVLKNGKSLVRINNKVNEEELNEFDNFNFTYYNFTKINNKLFEIKVLGERNNRIFVEIKGKKENRIYQFDSKTFRLLEYSTTQDSPMGIISFSTIYDNYTKIGNYFYPTTIKVNSSMFTSELNVKYEVNPKVQENQFEF